MWHLRHHAHIMHHDVNHVPIWIAEIDISVMMRTLLARYIILLCIFCHQHFAQACLDRLLAQANISVLQRQEWQNSMVKVFGVSARPRRQQSPKLPEALVLVLQSLRAAPAKVLKLSIL